MVLPITTTIRPDSIEATTTTNTISPDMEDNFTVSPTIMDMWMSQLQKDHPEISFVIPSQHDNQHIDNMMNFKRLLEQVGNTAYDMVGTRANHYSSNVLVDSMGQAITHEQISKSAVLNMADLKNNALSGLERFFAGTDMHSLINYLWIGVVTSLVILTVIFVLFSCHFYRKFREWKKCNKDIRAQFNNDVYPGSLLPSNATTNPEAAYYQMESPPCYTIATGLPTYDEALHHNQQQHFAFGMKFIYPTLAAVHHQTSNLISSWEKYDNTVKDQKSSSKTSPSPSHTKQSKCKSSQTNNSKSFASPLLSSSSTSVPLDVMPDVSSTSSSMLLPPSYEVAATMALLSDHMTTTCDNVAINMPPLDSAITATNISSDLTDIITV